MAKENLEKIENSMIEKTDILPEKQLKFNEDGTITIPEVTLQNPLETLKYLKQQEEKVVSKLRESNEYVVKEIKWMLEDAFQYWFHSDKIKVIEPWYTKSQVCSDHDYEFSKRYYVDLPIEFLSKYEWKLQNFMELLAQELKEREFWWGDSLYVLCQRFGISIEELKQMDTTSIVKIIKNDIKNIPSLSPTTQLGNMKEHLWAAKFYLTLIQSVCEKLWFKYKWK